MVHLLYLLRLQLFEMKFDERLNEVTQFEELRLEVLNALHHLLIGPNLLEYVL